MNQQPFLSSVSPLISGGEDLEKTVIFYEQKLGFKRIHQEGNPIELGDRAKRWRSNLSAAKRRQTGSRRNEFED